MIIINENNEVPYDGASINTKSCLYDGDAPYRKDLMLPMLTNSQGGVLSPKLFNVYIDGLSNILNNCTTGGFLGGKRINHMLYADDLCIVSLSSAGLQNLLSICDKYCASHSITFNVKKSVCMFFKSSVNKHCDYANVYLGGNHIDFVQEVKYLGVLLNSSMKTSLDVSRRTRKFYAQAIMLLRNFRYCGREVKCMLFKSFCTNMYCCPLWFNSTSSSIKKLKNVIDGITGQDNIAEYWRQHFHKILNANDCDQSLKADIMEKFENIQHNPDMIVSTNCVSQVIAKLECGKAAGSDGICAEYLNFLMLRYILY